MADFSSVVNAVPPVTRTLLIGTAIITLRVTLSLPPCLLGLVSPSHVALSWPRFFRFQVWRPVTAFFFGGSGFPLIYDFFLIYRNSSALERDIFLSNTAEYAWMHLVIGATIIILNIPFGIPFLFRPLLHAQTYIWCRSNPTLKVSIFGLITIPTSLYPPALIVLDVLTGGPMKALGGLMGLVSGHVWWFLNTYLPNHAPANVRRPNPLSPPLRFLALFQQPATGRSTTSWGGTRIEPIATASRSSAASQRSEAVNAVRHRWGGGQRLGGEGL